MKHLTEALLNLSIFVELSSSDIIDEDCAVKALEQMLSDLSGADNSELEYLKAVIRQRIVEMGDDRTQRQSEEAEFYLNLMESIDEL